MLKKMLKKTVDKIVKIENNQLYCIYDILSIFDQSWKKKKDRRQKKKILLKLSLKMYCLLFRITQVYIKVGVPDLDVPVGLQDPGGFWGFRMSGKSWRAWSRRYGRSELLYFLDQYPGTLTKLAISKVHKFEQCPFFMYY